jgi:outer membrane protein TolC
LRITREVGSEHQARAAVTVGWRAWDFGARDARAAAAESTARGADLDAELRAVELAYAARAGFLSALYFRALGEATEASIAIARADRGEHVLRRDSGLGDDLAIAAADARLAELEARLAVARESELRAGQALAILLGLGADAAVVPRGELRVETPASSPDSADAPAVLQLGAMEDAALLRDHSLELAFWPTLDLFGTFAWQFPKTLFDAEESGIAYAVGVQLTWELWDGNLRIRQRDELQATARQIRALRQAAAEEVDRGAAAAHADVRVAEAAERAARRSEEAARVYLEAARAALAAGLGTDLDVRKAADNVDRATLALVRARFDRAMAGAALLRAFGLVHADPPAPEEAP